MESTHFKRTLERVLQSRYSRLVETNKSIYFDLSFSTGAYSVQSLFFD